MTMNKDGVSDEALAEMLTGLDDLPPGPWQHTGQEGTPGHCLMAVVFANGLPILAVEPTDEAEYASALAAHINRCGPDTIRSIISELQERRAADRRAPAIDGANLPVLPKPGFYHYADGVDMGVPAYTEDQMRAYALAALSVRAEPVAVKPEEAAWLDTHLAELRTTPNRFKDEIAHLERIRSALAASPAPSIPAGYRLVPEEPTEDAWRPIETAPQDGSMILLWVQHANARFSKQPVAEGWMAPAVGYWTDFNSGGWVYHGLAGSPTMWAPIPAAHAQQQEGNDA